MAKPSSGKSVRGSLITSARWVGNVDDAARDYQLRRKLGQGLEHPRDDTQFDRIRVRLSTGGPHSAGTPLEVGEPIFTSVATGRTAHEAALRSSHRAIGVLLEPIGTTNQAWLQLSGICPAAVNVIDTAHTHCFCESGATELKTGFGGPIELVSTATATGSTTLLVRLASPLYRRRILTNEAILSNDFGDCNFYGGSTLNTVLGTDDVYFNWMKGGVTQIESGVEGWATWDDGICAWIIDAAECSS